MECQPVPLTDRRKGAMGDVVPDVSQFSPSSFVLQVGTHPELLDQWRSITCNRFVPNMVKGHHLQLRCHPPFFCNAPAHHSIIQKEVDELLALNQTRLGWFSLQHICYS